MNGNMGILLLAGGLGVAFLAVKGFGDKAVQADVPVPLLKPVVPFKPQIGLDQTQKAGEPEPAPWFDRPRQDLVALGDPSVTVGVS